MIRRAVNKDIEQIKKLLYQVHKVHSDSRADIFVPGERKYTDDEIYNLIKDDTKPIFVYVNDNDVAVGYAFCIYQVTERKSGLCERKSLYIDDLCVDSGERGKHIGSALYEFVLEQAKENGCDSVTLNVWNFNTAAMEFYKKQGLKPLKTVMEQIL